MIFNTKLKMVLLSMPAMLVMFIIIFSAKKVHSADKEPIANFDNDIYPVLKKHCQACHNDKRKSGGFNLSKYKNLADIKKDMKTWERVADNLRTGDMPPPGKPKPSNQQLDVVNRWMDTQVFEFSCVGQKDPGKVTMRRLNRFEYNNTTRDLFGVNFKPAEEFPADDVGYGFDNIGDVLTMPPILMEKYLDAAEDIIDMVYKNRFVFTKFLKVSSPEKVTSADFPKILEDIATKAYRRPATKDEVDKLVKLCEMLEKKGDKPSDALKAGLQAILVSPKFLFHVEIDPDPNSTAPHQVNQFELANRLSYFLWSTMPDTVLFDLAKQNKLYEKGVIEEQVARMLKDPKAKAFTLNFPEQWLHLRNLKTINPDKAKFPTFTDALRDDMAKEAELFFEYITKENRSILELLDADYTFLNLRLATHYGIKNVTKPEFTKVTFTDNRRGGVLTQAGVLTITSNPTRTSPVKRGKWVLENILGTPPPPPPPNVEELKEDDKALTGTLRQRMEQHRANPNCATCHLKMDALGFGLENFNPVGIWRDKDGDKPIDASGDLPGGEKFNGPAELRKILLSKSDLFAHCLCEKLLTYATGRGMERADNCTIDTIVEKTKKDNFKMQDLIIEIVKSEPFQMRKAKRGAKS